MWVAAAQLQPLAFYSSRCNLQKEGQTGARGQRPGTRGSDPTTGAMTRVPSWRVPSRRVPPRRVPSGRVPCRSIPSRSVHSRSVHYRGYPPRGPWWRGLRDPLLRRPWRRPGIPQQLRRTEHGPRQRRLPPPTWLPPHWRPHGRPTRLRLQTRATHGSRPCGRPPKGDIHLRVGL